MSTWFGLVEDGIRLCKQEHIFWTHFWEKNTCVFFWTHVRFCLLTPYWFSPFLLSLQFLSSIVSWTFPILLNYVLARGQKLVNAISLMMPWLLAHQDTRAAQLAILAWLSCLHPVWKWRNKKIIFKTFSLWQYSTRHKTFYGSGSKWKRLKKCKLIVPVLCKCKSPATGSGSSGPGCAGTGESAPLVAKAPGMHKGHFPSKVRHACRGLPGAVSTRPL